jgi:hypothetical protein
VGKKLERKKRIALLVGTIARQNQKIDNIGVVLHAYGTLPEGETIKAVRAVYETPLDEIVLVPWELKGVTK